MQLAREMMGGRIRRGLLTLCSSSEVKVSEVLERERMIDTILLEQKAGAGSFRVMVWRYDDLAGDCSRIVLCCFTFTPVRSY